MMDNKKIAVVIGATGLVGSSLVDLLLKNTDYKEVKTFSRRGLELDNSKLTEHLVDFDKPDEWSDLVIGDVLFSAMGTTLAQAGSKQRQYEIDYGFQYNTAKAAVENGVKQFVLISSVNADASSKFFYSRIKGELEGAVEKLGFEKLTLIRPGFLYGERKDSRPMEVFAVKMIKAINKLGLMRKYRPIDGLNVAKASIKAAAKTVGVERFSGNDLLYELAE